MECCQFPQLFSLNLSIVKSKPRECIARLKPVKCSRKRVNYQVIVKQSFQLSFICRSWNFSLLKLSKAEGKLFLWWHENWAFKKCMWVILHKEIIFASTRDNSEETISIILTFGERILPCHIHWNNKRNKRYCTSKIY